MSKGNRNNEQENGFTVRRLPYGGKGNIGQESIRINIGRWKELLKETKNGRRFKGCLKVRV